MRLYDAVVVGVGAGRDGQGGRDGAAGGVADADQLVSLALTGSCQVRNERGDDEQTQQGHDEPGEYDVESKEVLKILDVIALSKNSPFWLEGGWGFGIPSNIPVSGAAN